MSRYCSAGNALQRADAVFNNLYSQFFISVWVWPAATCPTNSCAIISAPFISRIPWTIIYGIEVAGGAQNWCCAYYDGAWRQNAGQALTLQTWSHLGFQLDSANNWAIRGYINGNEAPSNQIGVANGAAGAGGAMTIGRRWDAAGATPYFPGYIGEVAIWNRTLTTSSDWKLATALSYGASPLTIYPYNLVGYWPLAGVAAGGVEPEYSFNSAGVYNWRNLAFIGAPPGTGGSPEVQPYPAMMEAA